MIEGGFDHGGRVAGSLWRQVAAVAYRDGVLKVLMQVVDVFDHAVLQAAADPDVVEDREVLDMFAESDTAGVRADRYAAFGGHEEHGEDLVDSSEPTTVDLDELDCFGLQELFEQHAVLAALPGGHPDGSDGPGDGRMAENIIWAGGFLDPER